MKIGKITLNQLKEKLLNSPIFKNTYLILGAGKFGKVAIEYAIKQQQSSKIIVIDVERTDSIREFQKVPNLEKLAEILESETNGMYFLKADIENISTLFLHGFPEYFIPAVPIHAAAMIFQNLFKEQIKSHKINPKVPEDVWNDLLRDIPSQVLLKTNQENGIILLSWAKMDEICPSNCPAPLDYCPHHQREKPSTITEITKKQQKSEIGMQTIESHQLQPGLGVIYGKELKDVIVNCIDKIGWDLTHNKTDSSFYIATTCNCHGVINGFMCSRS